MPCYRPVKAWYGNKLSSGKREIVFSRGQAQSCLDLALPCGNCVGCYLERARQWAMRCRDEASLYRENCFVTLSINEESLKVHGKSLDVSYPQKFLKRLRKLAGPDRKVRVFYCGEYGAKFGRPHYHLLLFNWDFVDRKYLKTTASSEKIYTSEALSKLWTDPVTGKSYGYASVGDVTFGSAAYVARYHLKKVGNPVSREQYLDKRTGEVLRPEFIQMSRRPGIGRGWYDRFKSDVYPRDVRVVKGVDTKPCRFYDSLYEAENPGEFSRIKLDRLCGVNRDDNTDIRLEVKEEVKLAQVRCLKSSLED